MQRLLMIPLLLLALSAAGAGAGEAATGRIVKVLPLFLDLKGHDATSPSLFDRDAYQYFLRRHPKAVSAVRVDVLWRSFGAGNTKLKLRLELRGVGPDSLPHQTMLEQTVTPHFLRHWTSFTLAGDEFEKFGEIVAWRATLWSDDLQLGDQQSFLW